MSELQKLLKVSYASFVVTYPDLTIVESNPMGIQFIQNIQLVNPVNLKEVFPWPEAIEPKLEASNPVNIKAVLKTGEEAIVTLKLIEIQSTLYLTVTIITSLKAPDMLSVNNLINREMDHNTLFTKVFNHSPMGLVLVDQNQVLYKANKYIFDYFGSNFREIIGERFGNVFSCSTVQGSHLLCGTTRTCGNCMLKNGVNTVLTNKEAIENIELSHEFEVEGVETTKWFSVSIVPVDFDEETYAMVSFVDITHRVEMDDELRVLGITDGLTALGNRRHIINLLEEALKRKDREHAMAVALIDLDDFKKINDVYGHLMGDDVLVLFGEVLKMSVRLNDYVGRYGGEEFMILFFDTNTDDALTVIERIRISMQVQSENLLKEPVTFSCGLLEIGPKDRTINYSDLLAQTDKLLVTAKASGKNCNITGRSN